MLFLPSCGGIPDVWPDVLTWTLGNKLVSKAGLPCDNNDWLYHRSKWLPSWVHLTQHICYGLDIWFSIWHWSKHVLFSISRHPRTILLKASFLSQWDHFLWKRSRFPVHGTCITEVNKTLWYEEHNENLCRHASLCCLLCCCV